jgi:hypothetical protein
MHSRINYPLRIDYHVLITAKFLLIFDVTSSIGSATVYDASPMGEKIRDRSAVFRARILEQIHHVIYVKTPAERKQYQILKDYHINCVPIINC